MFISAIILSILALLWIYLAKSKPPEQSVLIETNQKLYWHLIDDLDHENTYAPWEDILSSKLVDPKDIASYLHGELYFSQGEFDSSGLATWIEHKVEDLVFVFWRSPKESWDHLAGREGYVVISKSEKKQVDFITTVLS